MRTKMILVTTLVPICLALPLFAFAEMAYEYNLQSKGNGLEEVYRNRITGTEIENMPSWAPEEGNPPLGTKQAVENARAYVQEKHPQFANSVVADVTLNQFYLPKYFKDKWYYIVKFMNITPNDSNEPEWLINKGNPEWLSILVMMDGSVPELKVEKRIPERNMTNPPPALPDPPPKQTIKSMPATRLRPVEN